MSEWFETLEGLNTLAWDILGRGETVCLATTAPDGGAEARMVVLRETDPGGARLEVQTDRASRKIAEIGANPLGTILLWRAELSFQIRARVHIEVLTGAAVADRWDAVPEDSRRNYGGEPPPSTPIASPDQYRETAERDRFAVLSCHVRSLDLVHLGDTHRRALFEAADGFAGRWLAP